MVQVSILQIVGLLLFGVIGICLFALQSEKFEEKRWQLFGTCVVAFIGTGIVGYLAFVPTPYSPPEILNDSYAQGNRGGAAGKSTGDGNKRAGGSGSGGSAGAGSGGGGGSGGSGSGAGGAGDASKDKKFTDCADCPTMIVVPKGENTIGVASSDTSRPDTEKPQVLVSFQSDFAVSQSEITLGSFKKFVVDTNFVSSGTCNTDGVGGSKANYLNPSMEQSDDYPIVCISHSEAIAYTDWLSKKAGKTYRLLSEAEWEYTRRAATNLEEAKQPRDGAPEIGNTKGDTWIASTTTTMSYDPNPFRIYDMIGNVAEWTLDCWHENHIELASTGTARTKTGDCSAHPVRGGSWDDSARDIRSSARKKVSAGMRDWRIGFRVMRPMTEDKAENQ